MAIAIANALILADASDAPRPGAILIEGRRIVAMAYGAAEAAALVARAREVHDAKGAIALPAFVKAAASMAVSLPRSISTAALQRSACSRNRNGISFSMT